MRGGNRIEIGNGDRIVEDGSHAGQNAVITVAVACCKFSVAEIRTYVEEVTMWSEYYQTKYEWNL